ncbi:hypothetical protein [Leptospira noguchii]|nr:hypothetical protein [Leptospira noguchii]UOG61817.1 hypothetical protein MAL07_07475 [Leptospira noguchii]
MSFATFCMKRFPKLNASLPKGRSAGRVELAKRFPMGRVELSKTLSYGSR